MINRYYTISKYKGLWKVNKYVCLKDSDSPTGYIATDGFNRIRDRVVNPKSDCVFKSLNDAEFECLVRNGAKSKSSSEYLSEYIVNDDGSTDCYYIDDNGNESCIKVW